MIHYESKFEWKYTKKKTWMNWSNLWGKKEIFSLHLTQVFNFFNLILLLAAGQSMLISSNCFGLADWNLHDCSFALYFVLLHFAIVITTTMSNPFKVNKQIEVCAVWTQYMFSPAKLQNCASANVSRNNRKHRNTREKNNGAVYVVYSHLEYMWMHRSQR